MLRVEELEAELLLIISVVTEGGGGGSGFILGLYGVVAGVPVLVGYNNSTATALVRVPPSPSMILPVLFIWSIIKYFRVVLLYTRVGSVRSFSLEKERKYGCLLC